MKNKFFAILIYLIVICTTAYASEKSENTQLNEKKEKVQGIEKNENIQNIEKNKNIQIIKKMNRMRNTLFSHLF